jgi:hypothetical protein
MVHVVEALAGRDGSSLVHYAHWVAALAMSVSICGDMRKGAVIGDELKCLKPF